MNSKGQLKKGTAFQRRTLGRTGLQVAPLGLGLAALGRPGYINLGHARDLREEYAVEAMRRHAHDVLDAAWEAGIDYFDAARSYGQAEEFLGSWLRARALPLDSVTVGSKWGYTYTAGWEVDVEVHEVKEHSLPVFVRQRKETQENLGQYLRLYQIHSATLDSGVLDNQAVLQALAELKASGVFIGLSLSGARQAVTLEKAAAVQIDGARLFDCVQATWNLLEPSAGPMLQTVRDSGMGVVVKEAVANGRLTARNTAPAFNGPRALLETQAKRLDTTIDALALAAVLAQPWADLVLSGASTVPQLRSNVTALTVSWDAEAAGALAALAEPPEVYWQTRAALKWN